MVAEAHDVLARLRLDLRAQRILLGVRRAREQEVLPDQQPQLVGQLVEVVGLVEPAAPDADEVEVRVERLLEAAPHAVARDAHGECVVGDPVDALHEHRLVVDDECERRAGLVGRHVPAHVPESDLARRAIENHAVGGCDELDLDVVQRLRAVPDRPPALHLGERERHGRGRVITGQAAGCLHAADAHRHDDRVVARALELDVHRDRAAVAVRRSDDARLRETRDRPGLEPDRLHDAARVGRDAPIPAEAARGLADRVIRERVRPLAHAECDALLVRVLHRRAEAHHELVVALDERVAHVEPVRAVLVRRRADRAPVEQDRRHGVQALEDEIGAVRGIRRPRECRRVRPVDESDPGQRRLVVVEERVGDETRGQEVGVHAPGHDGGDGIRESPGSRSGGRPQRPAGVDRAEGEGRGHLTAPAVRPL